MGLFDQFSSNKNSKSGNSNIDWTALEDIQQLAALEQASFEKPIAIFKHSTRCNISGFALRQFERDFNLGSEDMTPYFLDLLAHRDVSNAVAAQFGVAHQSPQLIVISGGKAVYEASHERISAADLLAFTKK